MARNATQWVVPTAIVKQTNALKSAPLHISAHHYNVFKCYAMRQMSNCTPSLSEAIVKYSKRAEEKTAAHPGCSVDS